MLLVRMRGHVCSLTIYRHHYSVDCLFMAIDAVSCLIMAQRIAHSIHEWLLQMVIYCYVFIVVMVFFFFCLFMVSVFCFVLMFN